MDLIEYMQNTLDRFKSRLGTLRLAQHEHSMDFVRLKGKIIKTFCTFPYSPPSLLTKNRGSVYTRIALPRKQRESS